MTLKKRLSISYLQMLIGAILGVVVLCVTIVFVFEKAVLPRLSETEIFDSDAFEVQEMMRGLNSGYVEDGVFMEEFSKSLHDYGFDLKLTLNNEVFFSNMNFVDSEAIESLERLNSLNGTYPMIYQIAGATMVQHPFDGPQGSYLAMAVSFSDISIFGLGQRSILDIFVIGAVIMIALIAIAILISCLFFSKIIHRKITDPVNAMCDAAERIKYGDFTGEIKYEGISEFENVCGSFNEMQRMILKKIEDQKAYDKRRNEVIAGISHDLKTPLTSIKGYVRGLKDGIANTPEKRIHYLNVIEEKSDTMSYLIERLLMFSKLETQEMPLNTESVNISRYMSEFIESVSEDLIADGIEIEFINNCTNETVEIDQIQMNRVFSNIIENSKKYNDPNGLKITVSLYARSSRAVIFIRDNGCGVSAQQLPKLFDSFYRGDEARSQNRKLGSGLGLAISKRLVELHGGTIGASNKNGLSIEITLPLERRAKHE